MKMKRGAFLALFVVSLLSYGFVGNVHALGPLDCTADQVLK